MEASTVAVDLAGSASNARRISVPDAVEGREMGPRSEPDVQHTLGQDVVLCAGIGTPSTSQFPTASKEDPQLYVDKFILNTRTDENRQNERSIYIGSNSHVPSSSLSFFSENGINALCQRLGHDKLKDLVNTLETDGDRRKQGPYQSPEDSNRPPEPPLELQMLYVRSYFEQVNPIYPFLDQEAFEKQAFSSTQQNLPESSQTLWRALYHAVLSLGCLYHDEASFYPTSGLPWQYFRVAFSYFTPILVSRPSLLKVQALTAMAIFALNYSSLHLETLCVSEAARAIVTMGLHKKNLDAESDLLRKKVFWVVYCLEKEYAFNSTQASIIPDLDISCPLPIIEDPLLQGLDWLQCWARFSRILSRAYDTCFSITATMNTEKEYFAALDQINRDLQNWRNTIPEFLRPEYPLRQHRIKSPVLRDLAVRIHLAYHNLRICLSRVAIHVTRDESQKRKSEAKKTLLMSARAIAELTQFIPLEPYSPVWNSGCMPLVAMFILFDFVVHNPSHPETPKNISYLHIVAAHFSRLELASKGCVKVGTVADFAAIAKEYADSHQGGQSESRISNVLPGFDASEVGGHDAGMSNLHPFSVNTSSDHTLVEGTGEEAYISPQDCFSVAGGFFPDFPDFPEGDESLFMTVQHPGFDVSDLFGQGFPY